jgi:outer membrane receptor protein involved in Fe transport
MDLWVSRIPVFSCVLMLPAVVLGQSTGQIAGTVEDRSAAVVTGAEVRAINQRTGIEWSARSDDAGRFSFPRLPIGEYRVEANKNGFRRFVSEVFRLDADQNRQVAVRLDLGQVTESVTVTGSVTHVETVGGTLKEVVDEKRISELPLNGRNPVQLILLVPGVVTGPGSIGLEQNQSLSVNGARAISNNYLLDGGDNNDPQRNTPAIVPNPDALEEFSVLTNNFGAEYGRSTGGIVNAVTKSGTNQFHGSAWEFLRNDRLDARAFFGISKGKLRRNQFGGAFGGPVIRNRTFFFGSYEGTRQRQAATFSSLVVPTAAERSGDFAASRQRPRDPVTNQPFPDARIPASRFDPAAVNFLNELVPLPNAPAGGHIFNRPNNSDRDQFMGRVDHTLTANQRITGRLFRNKDAEFLTAGLPKLQSDVKFDNWNITGQHTWTLSPALLAVGKFTFGQTIIDRGPLPAQGSKGVISYQSLGVNVTPGAPESLIKLVPHFRGQVTGFWNMAQDNFVRIDRQTHQATYDVTYTRGAHLMKFGVEGRWSLSDRITGNLVDPQFNFTGIITGNSFADFLIGRPANFSQGSLRLNAIRGHAYALYLQDDWKATKNLTFSLGVRWEPYLPFFSRDDELSVFRAGEKSRIFPNAPVGLVYAGDPGVPRGGAGVDWDNLGPRVSLAWRPFGNQKTSIRAAYGIFFDTPPFHELSQFVQTPPYSLQVRVDGPRSFSDPYGGRVNPFPFQTPETPEARARYQYILPVLVGRSVDADTVAGYNQQWNFNLQREVLRDFILTAAYVGAKATHLPLVRNLNPALFRAGAALGNVDARRIYQGFSNIENWESSAFSTYHAAQFSVNKRFTKGYTVLAHYTLGKTIDLAATDVAPVQNPLFLHPDKALSDFDLRQRFVSSFLWELPSPKSGFSKWVTGGWQTNGIFHIQSGLPFNVVNGQDIALSGTGTQRPNLVGTPFLDTGRPRSQLLERYFDPAAFARPTTGSFGNSGRNLMIGPGSWNLDFALFKRFAITESRELQFRWEMFNSLNHANLSNPDANISSPRVGRILSTSAARIMQFGLRLKF